MTIDNGNHLVLSGNEAVANYLAAIGASDRLEGPERASFLFADLRDGSRWTLAPNEGPLPWWIGSPSRRVPGTRASDYLKLAGLLHARADQTVADVIPTTGTLWDRLIDPFLLAALNVPAAEGSAKLAGEVVRQTLARGGRAYRPRIASPSLAAAFVEPAVAQIGDVRLGRRLRAFDCAGDHINRLHFGDESDEVGADEVVILAVPAWVAHDLLPEITVPDEHQSIINAHYRIATPPETPAMFGVIGGLAEWIFTFPGRVSVTISGANRLDDVERETLAQDIWADVARVLGLPTELPAWQIVREKRATFAATPAQDAKRPVAATDWANLFLAGDWTQTGLPSTIEGALRSGATAARLAKQGKSR
jgi:squalene-associated FAD-dependent desaturase